MQTFYRWLRSFRRFFPGRFPRRERLSPTHRMADFLRLWREQARGQAVVADLIGGLDGADFRLREEIDRMAGKEVYHGGKEQL